MYKWYVLRIIYYVLQMRTLFYFPAFESNFRWLIHFWLFVSLYNFPFLDVYQDEGRPGLF